MKSCIVLLAALIFVAVADPSRDYYPRPVSYDHAPSKVPHYQPESHSANPSVATAEDFAKIKCFGAFSFFVWYCPSHTKFQNYKLDVKYPTEQFWGRYQNEFDSFVAGGCDSKEGQMAFDKCLQMGAYLAKFVEAPKVFT